MKHFPRLVVTAGSVALLIGPLSVWAIGPEKNGAQLVSVNQDTPAMLLHGSQGYLGVEIRDIDNDRATALKLKTPTGAEIVYVDHDAPAGKAGLRVHDVILQMNGQTVQGVEQLRRMLHETPAGRSVTLQVSRDGQQQNFTVQLVDREVLQQDAWSQHTSVPEPDDDAPVIALTGPSGHGFSGGNGFLGSFSISPSYVGVELDTLGSQLADYFGVKDGQGLLVKRVAENSPASSAGLKAGDVITKVNGQTMATLNEWGKTIHANRGKQIQVTIVRNRKEQTLSMQAGDAKHKGELVLPEGFSQELKSQIEDAMANWDGPVIEIDPGQLSAQMQQSMKAFDAGQLAEQAQQAARSIDQKEIEREMKQLRESLKSFELHRMD